jgi:hypothetical protein
VLSFAAFFDRQAGCHSFNESDRKVDRRGDVRR